MNKQILALIGNIDHTVGNGPNAAKMRGDLLNSIRSLILADNTKTHVIVAAEEMLELAREYSMDATANDDAPFIDYDHLVSMVDKMKTFDDNHKLHRWLGWIQAAVYSHCSMTEDVMERIKEISHGT